ERARDALGGVVADGAPPESPLHARIGPHRRFAVVDARLDDFRVVKDAFAGTVNDVVLAVVAGALRHWLHARGQRAEGLEVRAGVPVTTPGGAIAHVLCRLPIDVADPLERLRLVGGQLQGLRESGRAVGADVIASGEAFAPPTLLAQASRVDPASRDHDVLVTNVPGPQVPLYVLGRRLDGMFPIPFLGGTHALAVAVISYHGSMSFGLLADYDAVADLAVVAEGVEASLAELLGLAAAPLARRKPVTTRTRARARARRAAKRPS
ncbi:MAG TPA: WS/DGAT domain-containing protein, partial [Solirubrobacteraceae bacterium]|nr:WS/DGAT domain-containing protein [Solirubrobacteraceae bacterium]